MSNPNRASHTPVDRGGDWVLVPRHPAPEMLGAFWRTKNTGTTEIGGDFKDDSDVAAYKAMIAAAPSPDEDGDGGELRELIKRARLQALSENTMYGGDAGNLYNDLADAIVDLVAHCSGKLVPSTGIEEKGGQQGNLQARNAAWMKVAFADDPTDLPERIARFGEESLELQQALGQSREDAHALVDYVYSRPAGAPATEFGQAAGSLACLAEFAGHDLEAAAEAELDRVSTPEFLAKLRAKRATRHGRGPLPGFSAPGTSEPPSDDRMTVAKAREVLDEVGAWINPRTHISILRGHAIAMPAGPERNALTARASRIEAALRTLSDQDTGEVRP